MKVILIAFFLMVFLTTYSPACTNSDKDVRKKEEDDEARKRKNVVEENQWKRKKKWKLSFGMPCRVEGKNHWMPSSKSFNDSQDKYEVNAEFQGSYEESLTKFRSVGGTKDAPAITQVFEVGTKYMIESGFIEPMQ